MNWKGFARKQPRANRGTHPAFAWTCSLVGFFLTQAQNLGTVAKGRQPLLQEREPETFIYQLIFLIICSDGREVSKT
jgi:hypothetical protein